MSVKWGIRYGWGAKKQDYYYYYSAMHEISKVDAHKLYDCSIDNVRY